MKSQQKSIFARLQDWVSKETTGGVLLLIAATIALIWANSPWRETYQALSEVTIGPADLHLNLSLATWASDGVLAIFFFVVGMELKRELVVGNLSNPREAAVPMISAVGGLIVPALVFVSVLLIAGDSEHLHGWAIPSATDIAFAVGVLAVFGKGLPRALRTFLLTLAVVVDLLAIIIIAAFYSTGVNFLYLAVAAVFVGIFAFAVRLRKVHTLLLILIFVGGWLFMHESGVHATIAGVAMGLTVPARPVRGEDADRAATLSTALNPLSSGIVLPIFAFFAAGVTFVGGGGASEIFGSPVFFAIALALVFGKFIGVMGTATLTTKLTGLRLPDAIGLRDLVPVGLLTGMGFTVSLLITSLSFPDSASLSSAKMGVLVGTLTAAILGSIALRRDASKPRSTDMNEDGIPDQDTAPIG